MDINLVGICAILSLFATLPVMLGAWFLKRALTHLSYRLLYWVGFGTLLGIAVFLVSAPPILSLNANIGGLVLMVAVPACELVGLVFLARRIVEANRDNGLLALTAMVIVPSILTVSWLGGTTIGEYRSERELAVGRERGETIYHAINAFVQDTHHPPSSLAELAPNYLPQLPAPPDYDLLDDNKKWTYHSASDGTFWLRFSNEEWDCTLTSSASQWECIRMGMLGDVLDETRLYDIPQSQEARDED